MHFTYFLIHWAPPTPKVSALCTVGVLAPSSSLLFIPHITLCLGFPSQEVRLRWTWQGENCSSIYFGRKSAKCLLALSFFPVPLHLDEYWALSMKPVFRSVHLETIVELICPGETWANIYVWPRWETNERLYQSLFW